MSQGDARNVETGCRFLQERLRRWKEQEFAFLLEFFYFIRDEMCDRTFPSWKENQLKNAFHHVWNVTPFPKEQDQEAVLGPSTPHSTLPGRDAEAELREAPEEGISEAAKQVTVEIRTEGALEGDAWFSSTALCGPAVFPTPAGHRMCCPVDCSCLANRDSELQGLKNQMQLILHTLGKKKNFETDMRSEGASSAGKETEQSKKLQIFFPSLLRWNVRPPMH